MAYNRLDSTELKAKLARVQKDIEISEQRLAKWATQEVITRLDIAGNIEHLVQNREGRWIVRELTETALSYLRKEQKAITNELRRREQPVA